MAKRTRAADAERTKAIEQLREWIKPGDTVYTILDHVSSSGMSRAIRVVIPYTREDGTIDHLHPNYAIGKALELRHWKRNGREQDALVMGGCGMDMGFALVYELSHVLYGHGYACLKKGKCPSNYHVNHHDHIRCPNRCNDMPDGTRKGYIYNLDGQDTPTVCTSCVDGYIPNPEGAERFDLTHTDGYALRHRWL